MKKRLLVLSTLLLVAAFAAVGQVVKGRITVASDNSSMPGVSIFIKGSTLGTTTDAKGDFSLNVPDVNNAVLVVSFIGYITQEIFVASRTIVDIAMTEDVKTLEEVTVTAFNIPKETKSLGYATTTIDNSQLTQTALPNFASALYGKSPGVRISSTPGGAAFGAVNINIRGVNSLTGKSQPLIVMNGVPIRDGEVSNNNYYYDNRIRGNGLLDLNPEDIESISILKGASAAALYGSDAVNGVVMVTTKTGKGTKGLGVNFSTSYAVDEVAYLPRYQNVRGNGDELLYNDAGQDAEGFIYRDLDGDGIKETRAVLGVTRNFGPKFDGKPTLSWDGVIRPYEAQKTVAGLFNPAQSKMTSLAVSYGGENNSTRFSVTRQDNEGISIGSKNEKNIINLNNSFKLGKNYSVDIAVNYINQYTHNRPYSTDRLINNFGGMMTRFDNPDWYLDKYMTSKGYKYVTGTNPSLTPGENLRYPGYRADILEYMWNVKADQADEYSNRIISSINNTWQIIDGLKLNGRFGADVTSNRSENRTRTTIPLSFGNSGGFSQELNTTTIAYTDIMLNYKRKITPDIEMTVMGGYTAYKEIFSQVNRGTNLGLSTENLFDLSASMGTPANSNSSRYFFVRDAFIGTVNANYKDFLFLEGTIRRDRTSTMNPANNSFVYPSVNASFVFSEALRLPEFVTNSKVRASWGIVGSYPDRYAANIAYSQGNLGIQELNGKPILYTTIPTSFGNDKIRPEQKYEFEIGWASKFLKSRLGLDITYYDGQIRDQILRLTTATSTGAGDVLNNVGTLRNRGLEVALSATPLLGKKYRWDVTLNIAKNENLVEKLASGSDALIHADYDGNAAVLKSVVGQPMGDIYVHPIEKHANGGLLVDPNGLYRIDGSADKMVKAGNTMPKVVGGLLNTFSYHGFTLNVVIDYRYGGAVMPTGISWLHSRGLTEESLTGMDAAHGGKTYYVDSNGDRFATNAASGPNGEKVYDNGIFLPGVKSDGEPNDHLTTNEEYYNTVYNWGGPQYNGNGRYELFVKENTYIKMRELSLSYRLPQSLASKIKAKNIEFSVFGRNLFFIYRSILDMDPEQTTAGSRWYQNVNNVGTNPATRTFGCSLRASF
jgi:iron complex outermembrane recepter protein